ncbi:MAG TPA: aldo/keto reductase [Terriglobales bacterium]|nr:aldo/keto reductase [Terriglobales bacterium]
MLTGFATSDGTARYAARFPRLRDAGHFRRAQHVPGAGELWLPSIGLGTYLGEPTDAADAQYEAAIAAALAAGVNLLDSAINYRHQRSERNIGAVLARQIKSGELGRDEVVVCTKAGFLNFDGAMPADPRGYLRREYVETGVLDPGELAGGMHCMSPSYIANQLERSRHNLGLETIDVFYVHNPESQLGEVPREEFFDRLRRAFVFLEGAVAEGKIRWYGTATWNAFRVAPEARDFINLADVLRAARAAGGDRHHFRFVQLPFNLGLAEAWGRASHDAGDGAVSALEFAKREGIAIVGSATLMQGKLAGGLPEFVRRKLKTKTDAEAAIQFSRSTPGMATALIGMGTPAHVASNLAVAGMPLAAEADWRSLFDGR